MRLYQWQVIFSLVVSFVLFFNISSSPAALNGNDILISLQCNGQALDQIVVNLEQQTGYTIILDREFDNVLINGSFLDIHIEYFFNRVLKQENYAVEVDQKNKKIYVKSFGKRRYLSSIKINYDNPTVIGEIDSKELRKLHIEQVKKGREKYEDQGIDSVTGLPLANLKAMQEASVRIGLEKYKNQGIDSVTGLPLLELKAIHEAAVRTERESYEDQGIDSVTGLPLAKLKAMHEAAVRIGREKYEDQGVDSVTGLPLISR